MKLKLKVTKEHIEKGEREDETSCPIALALMECTIYGQKIIRAVVNSGSSIACRTENGYDYKVVGFDPDIATFIDAFDLGDDVEPFEKELNVGDLNYGVIDYD